MKRLLTILLVLVMALLAFTSCQYLPDGVKDAIDNVFGAIGEHEHDFALTSSTPPTCVKLGVNTYTCSCGETKTETPYDLLLQPKGRG